MISDNKSFSFSFYEEELVDITFNINHDFDDLNVKKIFNHIKKQIVDRLNSGHKSGEIEFGYKVNKKEVDTVVEWKIKGGEFFEHEETFKYQDEKNVTVEMEISSDDDLKMDINDIVDALEEKIKNKIIENGCLSGEECYEDNEDDSIEYEIEWKATIE